MKRILQTFLVAVALAHSAPGAVETVSYLHGGEEQTPYFSIGGTGGDCETLVATNATHLFVSSSRPMPFRIGTGGTLAVRGHGELMLEDVEADNRAARTPWTLAQGALIDVSDSGTLSASNLFADVRSGELRVRDDATLHVDTCRAATFTVDAYANETAVLSVRDRAHLRWTCQDWHRFIVGSTSGGRAILNLDAEGTYDVGKNCYFELGGNVGHGELTLSKGYLNTSGHSPRIGGNGSDSVNSGSSAVGILRVTGSGVLDNASSAQYSIQLNGLVIGRGFNANPANPGWVKGFVYVGEQGVVTNRGTGYVIAGAGFATGEIHQSGGLVYDANTSYQVILGAWGGTGRWVVTNGVAHVRCDTYVGGIFTNQLAGMIAGKHDPVKLGARTRVDCHCATGLLQVIDGSFTCEKTVYAGMDGVGTVSVGPTGRFCAQTLCLTNVADVAEGDVHSSTLEFVFGESDVGTVTVTNLTIAAGTKLRVDVGRYLGPSRTFRLLTARQIHGRFAESDVAIVGDGAGSAQLQMDVEGLSIRILPRPVVWYTMANDSEGGTNVVATTRLANAACSSNAHFGTFVRAARASSVENYLPFATNGFERPMSLRRGADGPLRVNDRALCLPSDPEAVGDNTKGTAIRIDDPNGDLDLQTFTIEFFFRTKKWTNWHGLVVKPLDGTTASGRTNTFAIVERSYNRNNTVLYLHYACVTPENETVVDSVQIYSGSRPTIQDGDWHHVAVSVDGATHVFRLYIDGALKKTLTLPGRLLHGHVPGVSDWVIGGDPYGDWAWGGVVDEIRLTGEVLGAEDLLRVENAVVSNTVLDVASGDFLTIGGDLVLERGSELCVNGGAVEILGTLTVADGGKITLMNGGMLTADRIVYLGETGELNVRLGPSGGERVVTRLLQYGEGTSVAVDTAGYRGQSHRIELVEADETEGVAASATVTGHGRLEARMGGGLRIREPAKAYGLVLYLTGTRRPRILPAPPRAPTPFVGTGVARQEATFLLEPFTRVVSSEGMIRHAFHEIPRLVYGDKEIRFAHPGGTFNPSQLYPLSILRGGVELGRLTFWGSASGASGVPENYGYPFKDVEDDPPRLEWDERTGTIRYLKPYIAQDTTKRTFAVALTPVSNGLFRVDWDVGVPPGEYQTQAGVSPWFNCVGTDYRRHAITIGGVTYAQKTDAALIAAGNDSLRTDFASCDFAYASEAPERGFSLRFDPSVAGYLTESIRVPTDGRTSPTYSLLLRGTMPGTKKMSGTIWLDLGPAAVFPDVLTATGGVDFWRADAIEVPRRPTRNLLPNPGFEQGLRYWQYGMGGRYDPVPRGRERFGVVEGGLSGTHALVLRASQASSTGIQTFPMGLRLHQPYTFSFHAKGGAGRRVAIGFQSPGKTGQFANGVTRSFSLDGGDWQRFSYTFTDDCGGLLLQVSGDDGVLLDGLQLEEGETSTDWTCDPVEGVLRTTDVDNDIFSDEEIGASYEVFGSPGTDVKIAFRLQNAFRENVFEQTVRVRIGEGGRMSIPLALDRAGIGEGVFVLRAEYEVVGFESWCDHHRLAVMTPLENTHPTKDLFGTLSTYIDRIGRGEDLARKFRQWGFGSTTWGSTADMSEERNLLRLLKRNRITDYFRPIVSECTELNANYKNWTQVTPEIEALIEQVAYDTVRTNDPYCCVWGFGNEEEDSAWLCKNGEWDEYAKAQLACWRGVKRARADAIVVPTCGTTAYRPGTKYAAISNYMAAALRQNVRYDAIAIHQYGNIDGGLLGEYDMDVHTQHLVDEMNAFGYPASTPILTTEMFNQLDFFLPQWGCTGWGDSYLYGRPGYDFSHREFLQAASAARIYSIALKFWPKLRSINVWISKPFVDCHLSPLLFCKVVNTFGHHFPDVAYHGSVVDDVRHVRAYVYTRPDGRAVATAWTNDPEVDRGNVPGLTLVLSPAAGLDVYDFMGGRRVPVRNALGRVMLPLTPAPLILHADSADELLQTLETAELRESEVGRND